MASRLAALREAGCDVYNVFHPNDPVAYRLEPLLSEGDGGGKDDVEPPVFLSTSHGVDRVHVRLKKFGDEVSVHLQPPQLHVLARAWARTHSLTHSLMYTRTCS